MDSKKESSSLIINYGGSKNLRWLKLVYQSLIDRFRPSKKKDGWMAERHDGAMTEIVNKKEMLSYDEKTCRRRRRLRKGKS